MIVPRYPIYVPSKGRIKSNLTARFLQQDGTPFYLVVEPQEADEYKQQWGTDRVLTLPFSNLGMGSIPARNWIKAHATAAGFKRHWQLDDNCYYAMRLFKGKRIRCNSRVALAATEDFVDRYTNVAVAGLNYHMFAIGPMPPLQLNCHVYSCTLVLNAIPHEWRGRYNEDTDLCLQVLADGWCTVLLNAFLIRKVQTMTMKGGNADQLYQGDGRLKMARSLERVWPGVVKVDRRFQRPQHVISHQWRRFDTPLQLDPAAVIPKEPNEYGLELIRKS